jgi:hypothetical protein
MRKLILLLSLTAACSAPVQAPERHAEPSPSVLLDDGIPEYTDEDRAEAAEFMAGFTPGHSELRFDDLEDGFPKALDKTVSYTALTGWAIDGILAFQQEGAPGNPHCALFGLDCDDEWHAQATRTDLGFSQGAGFLEVTRNGCGSDTIQSDGQANLWLPCIQPYVTESDREVTWYFDESTCPASSRGRTAIRDGMRAVQSYMNRYSSITLREDTSRVYPEILIECSRDLASDTAASWQPMGDLTLRYGSIKAPGDINAITYEQCETRGLPGQFGRNYAQALDFMYSFDYAAVFLNWDAQFEKIAECTTDPTEMARVWRNTLLHELGHHLGFHHEGYDDLDFGIMHAGSISCDVMATYSRGFDDYHLFAIQNMDVDPNGDSDFLVWDEDLSCYNPSL